MTIQRPADQVVLYAKEDGIALVTLNRPEKLNAVSFEVLGRLRSISEEIKKDEEVRVVVLTGKGRAFCAGTDLSAGDWPYLSHMDRQIQDAKQKLSTESRWASWFFNSIPKPVICALNGAAVGLGAAFALQCDVRIASKKARWGEVWVRRGISPDDASATYLLPRVIGLSKACELVFSGEIIDAEEMLRIGLVSKVVPEEELMPAAMELAKKFKKGAPLAVQISKQMMYMGLGQSIEDHLGAVNYSAAVTSGTKDSKEGIRSFLEKREPRWTGS